MDRFRTQWKAACPQGIALSVHGPYLDLHPASCDPAARRLAMDRFRASYDTAHGLGAESVVFHTGWLPPPYGFGDWLENSITFWREFLGVLPPGGPHIQIENVFEPDWRPLAELMDALGDPMVSVCLDVGHAATVSPVTVSEWIVGLGGPIGWTHWHNNNGKRDLHAGLEDGILPMEEVIQLLVEYCPAAAGVLEIADLETARRSLFWCKVHGVI